MFIFYKIKIFNSNENINLNSEFNRKIIGY